LLATASKKQKSCKTTARTRRPGALAVPGGVVAALLLARSPESVGFLLKDNILRPEVLDVAIERVAEGGTFVDRFATVGFGDFVAQTNNMRLLVTLQMLINLVVVGAVIRLLVSAARCGVEQRAGAGSPGHET